MPQKLLASGAPVVLAGDYNVMPTDLDVYKPERWVDDALFRPEVREAFAAWPRRAGPTRCGRCIPDERIYTFWNYFRNAFARDAGLRIDHLLLSPAVAGRLVAAGVDRDVRGWEKASDHAPTWITLKGRVGSRSSASLEPRGDRGGRRYQCPAARDQYPLTDTTNLAAGRPDPGLAPLLLLR